MISLVQIRGVYQNTAGPPSTSLAYSVNVTQGNLLVVTLGAQTIAPTVTITDTVGTKWNALPVAGPKARGWYGLAAASGSNTVTLTYTGTTNFAGMYILEASGANTLDVTANGSGSGTAVATGNAATRQNKELLVGYSGTVNAENVTSGSGWTQGPATVGTAWMQYQLNAPASTYASTSTLGGSNSWDAGFASFSLGSTAGGGWMQAFRDAWNKRGVRG